MVIGRIKNLLIKVRRRKLCYDRRKKLTSRNFTIISNNCWGGFVYQYYGLKYSSPTIGLFFVGNDYVKFCRNIKHYVNQKLDFIPFEASKNYDIIKNGEQYPVARLDDIEIYFMHYKSEKEATDKWYRRCERINWDNIIYKISQREGYTKGDIEEFMQLTDGKVISFSYDEVKGSTLVKELKGYQGDEMSILEKYYDLNELINR